MRKLLVLTLLMSFSAYSEGERVKENVKQINDQQVSPTDSQEGAEEAKLPKKETSKNNTDKGQKQ